MEDSPKTVRPHKDYAKHGRAAKRARKSPEPQIEPKTPENGSKPPRTVKAVPRPTNANILSSTKDFDKIRIVRLLLAGVAPKDIAIKCKISVKHCQGLIREMDKDIVGLTWQDYLSLLLSKLRLILDNHTQNSADIQLAMLDVDQRTTALETDHQAALEAKDKPSMKSLQSQLTRLRTERAALRTELNANNTALTGNLSKMGVTTRPSSLENKEPTQPSTGDNLLESGELPVSYQNMSRGELLEGLAESNRAVNRHLRAEREKNRDSE